MANETRDTCPVCRVGRLHVRAVTYSRVANGLLISVPDTLQWTCDYCRHTTYDRQMMLRIAAAIGQVRATNNASRQIARKVYRPQIPGNTH